MTDTLQEGRAETLNQDPCPSPMLSFTCDVFTVCKHIICLIHELSFSTWNELYHTGSQRFLRTRHGEDTQEWHLHSCYLHAQLTWPVLLPRSLLCCEFPHVCNSQLTSFLRQKDYPSPISSTYCTFCLAQPVVCLLRTRHRTGWHSREWITAA